VETSEGRWLSYTELAAVRRIRRVSAIKLAQREGWVRQSGNDRARTVRVLVPEEWLTPAREPGPDTRDNGGNASAMPAEVSRLLTEANGRADAALALADRLGAQLADAGTRADRAEARAERAEGERDQARVAATEALEAAEALRQAERAWWGRGRWARLRAAWKGG
jgi:hypothetical protein